MRPEIIQFNRLHLRTIYILPILLFILSTHTSFGMGCYGTYYISGIAYSETNTILKNAAINIKFGNESKTILTDSTGHFNVELGWRSACPSGATRGQTRRRNKELNPQFVYFDYEGKEIRLKNEWERYAYCHPNSKDSITWKMDLNFSTIDHKQ